MWNSLKNKGLLPLLVIWAITLMVYLPVFDNGFLNWDDSRYITDNPMIRDLTFQKALSYFTSYYDGHYHPLTLLSLAIDYKLGGLDPWWFHLTSLTLHFINIALVYFFIDFLFKSYLKLKEATASSNKSSNSKASKNGVDVLHSYWIVPAIVSLLFAIHPANVESVAWMSERKNVLFTAFFMLSLLFYLQYLRSGSKVRYAFVFVWFVVAIFSKVTAVSLVFALVVIDYLLGRKLISKKVIVEKLPFFVFTVIFIVIGTFAQRHTWGYNEETGYTFFERIPLAANSLLQYFLKVLVPYHLVGFYPYPAHVNGTVPVIYWLSFIPLVFLAILLWIAIKRNRAVAFGLLFFLVNIIFLIKLVDFPIGNNKMGDRYLYVPAIGVFFMIAYWLYLLIHKLNTMPNILKPVIYFFVVSVAVVFGYFAHQRVQVWGTDISLFSDVVKSYPDCALAWNNMGMGKKLEGDKQGALSDFTKAIDLDDNNTNALLNRGGLLAEMGNPGKAVADFTKLIQINPQQKNAYLNRAMALAELKDWKAALADYQIAVAAMPGNALAFSNRGVAKAALGELDSAMADFSKAILIDPAYPNAYFNRGSAKARKNDFTGAIADFTKAIALNPNYIAAYINRADARAFMNDYQGAIVDYNAILAVQPNNGMVLYKRALATLKGGNKDDACKQFVSLKSRGMNIKLPDECAAKN